MVRPMPVFRGFTGLSRATIRFTTIATMADCLSIPTSLMSRSQCCVLLLLLFSVCPVAAQWATPSSWPTGVSNSAARPMRVEQPAAGGSAGAGHAAVLVGAGALGGVLGFAGGFALAATLFPEAGIGGGVMGGVVGESLMIPIAIHLANRRRGSYPTAAVISAGLGAIGALAVVASSAERPEPVLIAYLAVPLAQIAVSTVLERRALRE